MLLQRQMSTSPGHKMQTHPQQEGYEAVPRAAQPAGLVREEKPSTAPDTQPEIAQERMAP